MKILGWFSCGCTSAVACKLAIDRFGNDVDLYYIETGAAHEDNKRFINDCEKWYDREIKIVRSDKFNNPLEVAKKELFNTPFGAPCTKYLKKEVRSKVVRELNYPIQIFGFDYSLKDANRALRFSEQNEGVFYYPLLESGFSKDKCLEVLQQNNIDIPMMYKLGYHNNNCIGCFKGGAGYWNKIRVDFPNRFKATSDLEIETKHTCLKKNKKQLYLKDLPINAGNHKDLNLPDCGLFCDLELKGLKRYTNIDEIVSKIKIKVN